MAVICLPMGSLDRRKQPEVEIGWILRTCLCIEKSCGGPWNNKMANIYIKYLPVYYNTVMVTLHLDT